MKKRIRIPVLMSATGVWCSIGVRDNEEPDWRLLAECIDDTNGHTSTAKRYWIETEIEIPTEATESAAALAASRT